MMDGFMPGLFFGIVVGICLGLFLCSTGPNYKQEALNRNLARYVVNEKTGEVKFEWITPPTSQPAQSIQPSEGGK